MARFSMQGVNEMLFAQMERLDAADAESIAQEVERSEAMAKTAGTIVQAAGAMMAAARMQEQAQSMLASSPTMTSSVPLALLGQAPEPVALAEPGDVDWGTADAFLEANAESHSAAWLADRLRAAGVDVTVGEVSARCREIGVEPRLPMGSSPARAESDSYGLRGPAGAGAKR